MRNSHSAIHRAGRRSVLHFIVYFLLMTMTRLSSALVLTLAARSVGGFVVERPRPMARPWPWPSFTASVTCLPAAPLDCDGAPAAPPALGALGRRSWLGTAASSAAAAAAAGWVSSAQPSRAAAPQPRAYPPALCDPSVSTWRNPSNERLVHILGTAHISEESAQLAGAMVRDVRPDAVFVELDKKRIARNLPPGQQMRPDQRDGEDGVGASQEGSLSVGLRAAGPPQPPQQGPGPLAVKERAMLMGTKMVGNAIKGMYSKLDSQGFKSGEEFVMAIKEGLAINSAIVLGDRDVEVTLRRLTDAISRTDLKKLLASDSDLEKSLDSLMPGGGSTVGGNGAGLGIAAKTSGGEMTKGELTAFVETVKARENVRLVMSLLKEQAPEIYQAMVSERDEYMALGIDKINQFPTTVAVSLVCILTYIFTVSDHSV